MMLWKNLPWWRILRILVAGVVLLVLMGGTWFFPGYEKVFVSVRDTGIGIPKDSLKKIWERFYKTDLSRGKDKKGTGLGLSIVKEIIQLHGENINVVSTEGVGTEFIFSLSKVEEQ